jgi:hypothetical protein
VKTIERIMLAVNHRLMRLFEGWTKEEVAIFSSSLERFTQAMTGASENDRD